MGPAFSGVADKLGFLPRVTGPKKHTSHTLRVPEFLAEERDNIKRKSLWRGGHESHRNTVGKLSLGKYLPSLQEKK